MTGSRQGSFATILVVYNEEAARRTVVTILERANFRVLSAVSGADAMRISEVDKGRIDLLLSDVDLSDTSGPDLGQALKKTRPDLHVMLMSAGVDGNLLILNYGWTYVQRASVRMKLVEMVLEVLHAPDRSQLGGQERKDAGREKAEQLRVMSRTRGLRTTQESEEAPKAPPLDLEIARMMAARDEQ